MTPEEAKHRAGEARRLLDEPLLNEALDAIERAAIEEMLAVKGFLWSAERRRRGLADRVNTIREFRARLRTMIAVGEQTARGGQKLA